MTMEFRSRTFGQRLTAVLIVRSVAVWVFVLLICTMVTLPIVQHGKPLRVIDIALLLGLPAIGGFIQWLIVRSWKNVDQRKVAWDASSDTLSVWHHRLTSSPMSLGTVVDRIDLALSDVRSMRVLKGRGTQLRLHTSKGFLCLTNDLQSFDRLCEIVQQSLKDRNVDPSV